MASILLNRDYTQRRGTSHKAGDVVSVPFHEGLELVEKGFGVRWNGGVGHEPPKAAQPAPTHEPKPATQPKPKPQPKAQQQDKPAEAKPAEAKSQATKGE